MSERSDHSVRVRAEAEQVFGSAGKAQHWLHRPTPTLDGHAPADLLGDEIGTLRVMILLGQIAHGIAA